MARGDDDSSNRTRGRRKSPFPPLRLVQDLPDSDDAAPRSSSGAGKGVGGARVAKPRPSAQTGRSAHPSQGSVRRGLPIVLNVLVKALLVGARLLLVKLASLTQLRVD